ncbi:MAG: M23 family metallopeptidase [Fimbriimonadaceae bacterium]|nr:M23 family metallopeptidase [Chitinophagales bacterium]
MAKKVKYFYNPTNLRFEKLITSGWVIFMRVFGWICTAAAFAFIIIWIAYTYLDSPNEKYLKEQLSQMEFEYELMSHKLDTMDLIMNEIAHRDDNIYRTIFEAEPISRAERVAGIGGSERFKRLNKIDNAELIKSTASKLELIRRKMVMQSRSFDEISKLVEMKEEILSATPAIQPVSNKDLERIASGFGFRIHPIYKVPKFHEGIDFTAPKGTDVFATADGVVEQADNKASGFGNVIVINHSNGYKTRYAHLNGFAVHAGEKVKRGELIGYVGTTGLSTAPHLHYEVEKDGVKIDPINFFYNDLSAEEYARLIELANQSNQSYD